MSGDLAVIRRTPAAIAAALMLGCSAGAHADAKLVAHYTLSVARIPVGAIDWTLDIGTDRYSATASGHASGVMKVLASGNGTFETRGLIKDGAPSPTQFTAKTKSENDSADVTMTLDDGTVTDLKAEIPSPSSDRVPLTDADRRGVLDPLSAVVVAAPGSGDIVSADICNRTLPVFDGRRRFNLALSFKRIDKVAADKGYAGTVVVCAVKLEAIAGYRPTSPLVKYLTDGRDIELWLAPLSGARLLAPFRLSVASMLGNLVIAATSFETGARAPAERAGDTAKPD